MTGVPAEQIEKAATMFGQKETGMIFTARGVEQQTDGSAAVRNFLNILIATGKIGKAILRVMERLPDKEMGKEQGNMVKRQINFRDIVRLKMKNIEHILRKYGESTRTIYHEKVFRHTK